VALKEKENDKREDRVKEQAGRRNVKQEKKHVKEEEQVSRKRKAEKVDEKIEVKEE